MSVLSGIHHVTAICGDPQANLDFYAGLLGLRLVKRTVNFDDPTTYHLYYGDGLGSPGTIMTFFPWPGAPRGRHGTGQTAATAFAAPADAIGRWAERLRARGVEVEGPTGRFGQEVLAFADPDGLRLEIVGQAAPPPAAGWPGAPVAPEHALRGFAGVTLAEATPARTDALLTGVLGWSARDRAGDRTRYRTGGDGPGLEVDVLARDERPGHVAVGTIHHVAWRARDDDEQAAWRERLLAEHVQVTPVMDRRYFRSIYFREPGGVLFEIATDPPGFALDESPHELGGRLQLPTWLEPRRAQIEAQLPPLTLP